LSVKPALTPEQWATRKMGGAAFSVERRFLLGGTDLALTGNVALHNDKALGLAALALDHNPGGFTWDDVDAISAFYDPASRGLDLTPQQMEDAYRSIAQRIEALLPPRT
jgi:hypothetical protein